MREGAAPPGKGPDRRPSHPFHTWKGHQQFRGVRITLLESDDNKFDAIFRTVRDKILEYLKSA